MGLGKLIFLRRRRINRLMKLNRDELDYYSDLNNVRGGIKDFDLKGKSVSFYFHIGNCHVYKDPSQGCSLFLQGLDDLEQHNRNDKFNAKHCLYVNQLMQEEPKRMFPINLYKYKCGHYSTGQGQHRFCISGTLSRPIPTVILGFHNHLDCGSCSGEGFYTLKSF
ncbi:hypothetical protein [Paenibacillus glucanolyticus]|uniref:hypothetical protein n=1 Tax=Paenibacillus glucanolyticus TaxID=59843 RepID=UPI00128E8B63|nr:hypothetical protein [Paenibacillus glucanolyticus]MPY17503.1 hypothetical protein [Paenibacillus glucanolyticus]